MGLEGDPPGLVRLDLETQVEPVRRGEHAEPLGPLDHGHAVGLQGGVSRLDHLVRIGEPVAAVHVVDLQAAVVGVQQGERGAGHVLVVAHAQGPGQVAGQGGLANTQ